MEQFKLYLRTRHLGFPPTYELKTFLYLMLLVYLIVVLKKLYMK